MEKFEHKLTKTTSGSYIITVPKEIVKKYKWKEKQKMTIEDKGNGKVEIRNWKRK